MRASVSSEFNFEFLNYISIGMVGARTRTHIHTHTHSDHEVEHNKQKGGTQKLLTASLCNIIHNRLLTH